MLYLDHAATTPPDPRVVDEMGRCMLECFANPSAPYQAAGAARRQLRLCRETLADMLACDAAQIFFTSGGTESNNQVLHAFAGRPMVLSAVEHSSVWQAARLARCRATPVQPDENGVVRPEAVESALRPDTALICVQAANNETGVLQPVADIGRLARRRGIHFHVDAVQAFGQIPLEAACCDSMSLSAHKIYGPRGAGALYVRSSIAPLMAGGGQEAGLRPGTENVAAVCGFRMAAELAREDMARRALREERLLRGLIDRLRGEIPALGLLGEAAPRLPQIAAVYLPGLSAEMAIAQLDLLGVQVSGGAACASRSGAASPAYRAMGLTEAEARCVLRVSVGRHTGDLTPAADAMARVYARFAGR